MVAARPPPYALQSPGFTQHLHDLLLVVPRTMESSTMITLFAANYIRYGVELQSYAQFPHLLGGLDKGASHITVFHQPFFKGQTGLFGETQGGSSTESGTAITDIGINVDFPGQLFTQFPPRPVDINPIQNAVGTGKIDIFKMQWAWRCALPNCKECIPSLSITTISPAWTSRINSAPTVSRQPIPKSVRSHRSSCPDTGV